MGERGRRQTKARNVGVAILPLALCVCSPASDGSPVEPLDAGSAEAQASAGPFDDAARLRAFLSGRLILPAEGVAAPIFDERFHGDGRWEGYFQMRGPVMLFGSWEVKNQDNGLAVCVALDPRVRFGGLAGKVICRAAMPDFENGTIEMGDLFNLERKILLSVSEMPATGG